MTWKELLGFVWKVCFNVQCHHRYIVVGTCIFKVDNTSIEHKSVLRQLWDGKMFFFPENLIANCLRHWHRCTYQLVFTPRQLPSILWPSMNPFLVFQHYGPLKVLLSLSLDKLSNDWFTFPLPADGTEYKQWSPCQGCGVWAGYHSFRKVRTKQSHGESWVCQKDKEIMLRDSLALFLCPILHSLWLYGQGNVSYADQGPKSQLQ